MPFMPRVSRTALAAVGVLAFCMLMTALGRGMGETFAVFLLPLGEEFGWERASVVSITDDQRLQMLLLRGRQGHPSYLLPLRLLLLLLLLRWLWLLLLLLLLLRDGRRTEEGFGKIGVKEGERAEIVWETPSLIA